MSTSNSGDPGFDPSILSEQLYRSADMQPAFLRSAFGARINELCTYVDREAAAHVLHHGLGELATRGKDVRERRQARGRIIRVMRHYSPIDYDPEQGNTDARRTVVLSEDYQLITEPAPDGGGSFPVIKRDSIPTMVIVPLSKPGNTDLLSEIRYERRDLVDVDQVLRGSIPQQGGKRSTGIIDLFLTKPSDDPELLRRKQEQDNYIGWLRKIALHLGHNGVLMRPYQWLGAQTSQN